MEDILVTCNRSPPGQLLEIGINAMTAAHTMQHRQRITPISSSFHCRNTTINFSFKLRSDDSCAETTPKPMQKISTTQVTYIIFCSKQKTRILLTDKNKVFRHDALLTFSHLMSCKFTPPRRRLFRPRFIGCRLFTVFIKFHTNKKRTKLDFVVIFHSSLILRLLGHKHVACFSLSRGHKLG